MFEMTITLIGAAIVFGVGLWAARTARERAKAENRHTSKAAAATGLGQPIRERGETDHEPNGNQVGTAGMGMAASGSKN